MRRLLTALIAALLIVSGLGSVARAADPPPPAPGPTAPVEKTEADAGCVYGSQPASSFVPRTYSRTFTSALSWEIDHRPTSECNLTIGWFPFARHTISSNYTFVAETENNGPDANNGPCPSGPADPECKPGAWQTMWAQAATYKCTAPTDLNCVSSVEAIDESGTVVAGKYLRGFPDRPKVAGSKGNGAWIADGGATPLWEFDLPSGKLNVLSNGVLETNWSSQGGNWVTRSQPSYRLTLFGVNVVADPKLPKPKTEWTESIYNGKTVKKFASGYTPDTRCLTFDEGECALEVPLPDGYRWRVTVQMPEGAMLFLNARLRQPTAYTEPIAGGFKFVIEAAPADVLSVAQVIPKAVLSRTAVEKALADSRRGDGWIFARSNVDNFSEGAGTESLVWVNTLMPYLGDRSSWVSRIWSLSTVNNATNFGQQCQDKARNSFLGVVSTNATAYTAEPPKFNQATSSLEYEVSAPHFLPDGTTVATGRYALNLNADFMTCLLGVSKVPDQAKIELTYGTGEVNAATINVKQTKNWLTLIAENFTYSSPKISVSFPKAAAPVQPSKAVVKSVTCAKGKTTKKFTGTKCPSGWKKK